jgi:hypothetical protein
VTISASDDGYDLEFDVSGEPHVELTIELTFRPGGVFEGVQDGVEENGEMIYHLVEGSGSYSVGEDTITFGPGNGEGPISNDGGEQVSWVGGKLVLQGHKVYITGVSPLKYTLNLGFP